jgi:pimeloyl-ACP methyl ester carboxylesterase
MPHSISSVFSEYYAAKYPEEVRAIISLDGTSSAYYAPMPAFVKSLLGVAKFQQAIGFTSVIGSLVTKRNLLLSYGYSEKENK